MKHYDHAFHAFLKGIILLGFALLMLSLILSGNIVYYIAPKMMPFIYFAMTTFFILGIMQVFRSTKKESTEEHVCSGHCDHDHEIKGPFWLKGLVYSIFILPVLFGFIIPDQMLNSSVAANRGINYGSDLTINQVSPDENSGATSRAEAFLEDPEGYVNNLEVQASAAVDAQEHYQVEDFYGEDWFDEFYKEFADELEQSEVILVTEDNYLDVMTVLDLYLDRFVGKEIEMIGFVFREPDFEDHQLVAARFSMTCCTADAGVYGTLVESEEAYQFEEDTWVYVNGTIRKGEYGDYTLPVIEDSYITEVEEPDTPYVYPSFNR